MYMPCEKSIVWLMKSVLTKPSELTRAVLLNPIAAASRVTATPSVVYSG